MAGKYRFEANFFSNSSIEAFGPVTLSLDFYTDYGRDNEKKQTTTLRIDRVGEDILLGELTQGTNSRAISSLGSHGSSAMR